MEGSDYYDRLNKASTRPADDTHTGFARCAQSDALAAQQQETLQRDNTSTLAEATSGRSLLSLPVPAVDSLATEPFPRSAAVISAQESRGAADQGASSLRDLTTTSAEATAGRSLPAPPSLEGKRPFQSSASRSHPQPSPAAHARLISATLQSASLVRDPLTFESTLCASIVHEVDTDQYTSSALVLAVVAVPDDNAFKALLANPIRIGKVLSCLCNAASSRHHEVSFPPEPRIWRVVAQCVWEDFVKQLDLLSTTAQVNAWLEFGQVEYEGASRFRDAVTRHAFESTSVDFDARACAMAVRSVADAADLNTLLSGYYDDFLIPPDEVIGVLYDACVLILRCSDRGASLSELVPDVRQTFMLRASCSPNAVKHVDADEFDDNAVTSSYAGASITVAPRAAATQGPIVYDSGASVCLRGATDVAADPSLRPAPPLLGTTTSSAVAQGASSMPILTEYTDPRDYGVTYEQQQAGGPGSVTWTRDRAAHQAQGPDGVLCSPACSGPGEAGLRLRAPVSRKDTTAVGENPADRTYPKSLPLRSAPAAANTVSQHEDRASRPGMLIGGVDPFQRDVNKPKSQEDVIRTLQQELQRARAVRYEREQKRVSTVRNLESALQHEENPALASTTSFDGFLSALQSTPQLQAQARSELAATVQRAGDNIIMSTRADVRGDMQRFQRACAASGQSPISALLQLQELVEHQRVDISVPRIVSAALLMIEHGTTPCDALDAAVDAYVPRAPNANAASEAASRAAASSIYEGRESQRMARRGASGATEFVDRNAPPQTRGSVPHPRPPRVQGDRSDGVARGAHHGTSDASQARSRSSRSGGGSSSDHEASRHSSMFSASFAEAYDRGDQHDSRSFVECGGSDGEESGRHSPSRRHQPYQSSSTSGGRGSGHGAVVGRGGGWRSWRWWPWCVRWACTALWRSTGATLSASVSASYGHALYPNHTGCDHRAAEVVLVPMPSRG